MTAPKISPDGSRLTVHIPLTIRRRGGRKIVVAPQGEYPQAIQRPRIDSTLVKAIARAHRWQRLIEEGAYSTLRELAAAECISPTYVSRLLKLTLLSPEAVEKLLDGDLPKAQAWPETKQLWCEQKAAMAGTFPEE